MKISTLFQNKFNHLKNRALNVPSHDSLKCSNTFLPALPSGVATKLYSLVSLGNKTKKALLKAKLSQTIPSIFAPTRY